MGKTIAPHPDVCGACKHYKGTAYIEVGEGLEGDHVHQCAAFDDIPFEILTGENDHTKPYPGDNGVQFERG